MKVYYNKKQFIDWLTRELGAKQNPSKPREYNLDCPFCDKDKKHKDYDFNVEQGVGNCFRGFSKKCESGHNVVTFVMMYYGLEYEKAQEFVQSNFTDENMEQRLIATLKEYKPDAVIEAAQIDEVHVDLPENAVDVANPKTKGALKALVWLIEKRTVRRDVVEIISPKFLGDVIDRNDGWYKYRRRVFFPVSSGGEYGWIAYSMNPRPEIGIPKTMNPKGPVLSRTLYLYDLYEESKGPAILCEGIFDAIRLFSYGYNAMAIFGTNVSDAQIKKLNELNASEVCVCLDSDARTKADRVCKVLNSYFIGDVSRIDLPEGDPDECQLETFRKLFDSRTKHIDPLSRLKRYSLEFSRVSQ